MFNQLLKQPLETISYFIVFLILIYIFYILLRLIQQTIIQKEEIKKYTITLPKHGDGKGFLLCPEGCNRGKCVNKDTKQGHCQFDFQCQMCEDRVTKQFYVGGNYENEKKILPTYEQPKIHEDDFDLLNKDIQENNQYVKKLNETIQQWNGIS
jgi:hypothetical protein